MTKNSSLTDSWVEVRSQSARPCVLSCEKKSRLGVFGHGGKLTAPGPDRGSPEYCHSNITARASVVSCSNTEKHLAIFTRRAWHIYSAMFVFKLPFLFPLHVRAQVGKGRAYTPAHDDVGYTLKFEMCIVDRNHNVVSDAKVGVPTSLYSSRVRPIPNPPQRALVRLVPPVQTHAGNRFTVLSYNLLADLYAKVTRGKGAGSFLSTTGCKRARLSTDGYPSTLLTIPYIYCCDNYKIIFMPTRSRLTSPSTAPPGLCTGTTASAICYARCWPTRRTSCASRRCRATTSWSSGSLSCRKQATSPSTRRRRPRSTRTTSMPLTAAPLSSGGTASSWLRSECTDAGLHVPRLCKLLKQMYLVISGCPVT